MLTGTLARCVCGQLVALEPGQLDPTVCPSCKKPVVRMVRRQGGLVVPEPQDPDPLRAWGATPDDAEVT